MDKPFRRETRETLTSEALSKRFKSPFDMVNYAIHLAGDMINAGRTSHANSGDPDHPDYEMNIANAVLAQIAEGKDRLPNIMSSKGRMINGEIVEECIICEIEEQAS